MRDMAVDLWIFWGVVAVVGNLAVIELGRWV